MIADGANDSQLLQAADTACGLSTQVATLQSSWAVTGSVGEVLRPLCILTGDGKGMPAMHPGVKQGWPPEIEKRWGSY